MPFPKVGLRTWMPWPRTCQLAKTPCVHQDPPPPHGSQRLVRAITRPRGKQSKSSRPVAVLGCGDRSQLPTCPISATPRTSRSSPIQAYCRLGRRRFLAAIVVKVGEKQRCPPAGAVARGTSAAIAMRETSWLAIVDIGPFFFFWRRRPAREGGEAEGLGFGEARCRWGRTTSVSEGEVGWEVMWPGLCR